MITYRLIFFQSQKLSKNLQHLQVLKPMWVIFEQGKVEKLSHITTYIHPSYRFENMKTEKEDEVAKRVAEEREKRAATEQKLQQQQQPSDKDKQEEIKQEEPTPITKETTREPSPARPTTPPPPEESPENVDESVDNTNVETTTSTANLYENDDNKNVKIETSDENIYENIGIGASTTDEGNQEEPTKFVGGIDVTSLLRRRKTSSSSSKNDDDDDESGVDKNQTNEGRSSSPIPAD